MRKLTVALFALAACASNRPMPSPPPSAVQVSVASPVSLADLAPGLEAGGFVTLARYVDESGRPRGARFRHARSGFLFDYLEIESAPQGFVYVTTYPTSDNGAAHTQEHLLLGRGNKGRYLGNYEHANLASSSAFTAEYRTAYHFHTVAGPEAFWGVLRSELDAIVHPDYSDTEIRREVRDFGVARGPTGELSLDEKGTVYNEMVRTCESADVAAWYAMLRQVYGPNHPLAFSSGGTPEGIRTLTPRDIREFHAAHYRARNMGMVGAFPASVTLPVALAQVSAVLSELDGGSANELPRQFMSASDLPAPAGAPAGSVEVVPYPHATRDQPGPLHLAWPATRRLDVDERILVEAFLGAFAGGPGSTLYQTLIDRRTQKLDVGATGVWGWISEDLGQPVIIGLTNVAPVHATEARLRAVRTEVATELGAIAALPDGSAELAAFGERVMSRLIEARRGLDKLLDTPPEFGRRGTSDRWIRHLEDIGHTASFDKSLTQRPAIERAMSLAAGKANPWRDRIRAWGLLDEAYGVVAVASPEERARLTREREGRLRAEEARLVASLGAKDVQDALGRRLEEIDRDTKVIADAEASVPMPRLTSSPPMTDDDALVWTEETRRGVPMGSATFEGMKSATIGIALSLDGVADEDLRYVAVLPSLLRDVGVLRGGVAIPYDELRDRLRREVLGVGVRFATSFSEKRAELVLEASGNDEGETRLALGWLRDMLFHADWREQNLPRLRDVVASETGALRSVMTGAEEHWAERTEEAYWRQTIPVLAHAGSFLTRAHDAHRLSWMLDAEAVGADGARRLKGFFDWLAKATGDREELSKVASDLASLDQAAATESSWVTAARALPRELHKTVARAGRDLGQLVADVPDESLHADWARSCHDMARDLAQPAAVTLGSLRRVMDAVRNAHIARAWAVGSSSHLARVRDDVDQVLGALSASAPTRVQHSGRPHILDRARERGAIPSDPSLVALVNRSTASAAMIATAPLRAYDDPREDALVDYLSANIFNGSGAHSFYKRIWGTGLAYSGYTFAAPRRGRYELYVDRCADLPQLLRFLRDEILHAPADPRFTEYSLARAFGARVADTYEARAEARANDLADGFPPERVKAFRARLLAIRDRPGLELAMHARLATLYGGIIPTLPAPSPPPSDAVLFAIGPLPALAAYERELVAARGARVLRLYPRDFWY